MYAFDQTRRHRGPALIARLAAIAILGAAILLPTVAAQDQGQSPAQGHAEVIAEGIASLPGNLVAWRAVTYTAKAEAQAPMAQRSLGFVLGEQTPILVTDGTTGRHTQLLDGEAAFVADGQTEQRASLSATSARYIGIELVPTASTQDTGSGTIIATSGEFAPPSGEQQLSLLRDMLNPGEETQVADPGTPLLVLVTNGTATVKLGDMSAPEQTLNAGQALANVGNLVVKATGPTTATFVVAMIGPAAGQSATPSAATAPPIVSARSSQLGSIALLARRCMTPAGPNPPPSFPQSALDSCQAFPKGWDITLTGPNGGMYTLADAQVQQVSGMSQSPISAYVWSNLPLGNYTFGPTDVTLPSGVSHFVAYFDDAGSQPFSIQTGQNYTIPVTSAQPDRKATIVFGVSAVSATSTATTPTGTGTGTGTIVVQTERCAASAGNVQPGSHCSGPPLPDVTITVTNTDTGQAISGQTDANGYLNLTDLPASPYQVTFSPPQPAGETFGVCGGQDQSADLPVVKFDQNAVSLDLPAGKEYDCNASTLGVFAATAATSTNATTGTVMAKAESCPAGFNPDTATVKEHGATCETIDVTLHLVSGGQDLSQTTSGRATWQNVPPGPITISEDLPSGQPAPVTVCQYWTNSPDGTAVNGGQLGSNETSGNHVDFTLQPGQTLSCWFDHLSAGRSTPAA